MPDHNEITKGTELKKLRPLFSVVVTNWNGSDWIVRCLSSIQLSARKTGKPCEIIMVDDASDDASVSLVESKFQNIRIIRCSGNEGYAAATNRGVEAAHGRLVVLANNDLAPKENFIPNLLRWFVKRENRRKYPDLFGVSARTLSWYDGQPNQLCMSAHLIGGRITQVWSNPEKVTACAFVQAGAAIYDRKKFLALGGLSPVFHPGYWEDYDLSWQANKRGWACLYDPDAVALHHGGGSMTKRYGQKRIDEIKARNHILFEWMNITSPSLFLRYFFRLGISVFREWSGGRNPALTKAVLTASPLFAKAFRARLDRTSLKSDHDVLNLGKGFNRS